MSADPQLVTRSSLPDAHFVREAAVGIIAINAIVGHDSHRLENAVEWARALVDGNENAEHDGDCTNQPMTCIRCLIDEAMSDAQEVHDD